MKNKTNFQLPTKSTISPPSIFHLNLPHFSTKELISYQLWTKSTYLHLKKPSYAKLLKKEPKTTAPAAHTPIKSSKGKTISDINLTPQGNQSSSFKNNNLNLTLIYISLIMFTTQHHTQNSTYNPLTCENLQTHNTSTSHNQTMLTTHQHHTIKQCSHTQS